MPSPRICKYCLKDDTEISEERGFCVMAEYTDTSFICFWCADKRRTERRKREAEEKAIQGKIDNRKPSDRIRSGGNKIKEESVSKNQIGLFDSAHRNAVSESTSKETLEHGNHGLEE